ncbi:MAG: hypothetical protein IJN54_07130 [Lachnospiraceae bacterium]|nr:hypothetical protein [Lachnospiraceae bacterium]
MNLRKNYIFTNKRYSEKSIMSTILGLISLGALVAAIYYTFLAGGEAMVGYGMTGLLAAIFSVTGLVLGILSKLEKDKFYLFSYIGIVTNALAVISIICIIYVGNFI